MTKHDLLPFVGVAQDARKPHPLTHPTPAHIKGCVIDALHDLHERGVYVPPAAFQAVRDGVAKANAEFDAGVL